MRACPAKSKECKKCGKLTQHRRTKKKGKNRIMKKFSKVFDSESRPINGPPCHFVLKDGAFSVAMRGLRPVAVPLMPKLKEEVDTLEEQGIIYQVTKPTA